ncbi:poly(U)-specific endoribonuclease homolog [Diachasma alloeum]|uniref:poly(U)-specific endoribonuclease homolog n=1 Tax=Diachasma alloeum TaxID=454923 RepID=UPI00073817A3|nr:poly(U)-specific endoribonuclease homolog [Diachasma alloeum]
MAQTLIPTLIFTFSIFTHTIPHLWTNKNDLNIHSLANESGPFIPTLQGIESTPKNFNKSIDSSRKSQKSANTVSNAKLERLSEALFSKDVHNAWGYIKINLQNQTTRNSPVDRAPEPLLTVNPEAFKIPTINCILQMYDNYHLDTRKTEETTPVHKEEQDRLLDAFLGTNVMATAMKFLSDNNYLPRNESNYRATLITLWFSPYRRGEGKTSSSGFEHVFLNELRKGRHVLGLHNWIYFNAVESKRQANYLGYLRKIDLGDKAAVLAFHFTFNSHDKPITSMFVGTSPELEMALYTVCFYVRRGKKCKLSLGGSKFRIITHELTYKGKNLPVIGSAFPLM